MISNIYYVYSLRDKKKKKNKKIWERREKNYELEKEKTKTNRVIKRESIPRIHLYACDVFVNRMIIYISQATRCFHYFFFSFFFDDKLRSHEFNAHTQEGSNDVFENVFLCTKRTTTARGSFKVLTYRG